MDPSEIRALPIEERDRILGIQVDFSLIADALNMCAHAIHGIIEAETVAEVTPEDLNDAEVSLPRATEALARLKDEFERSETYLESAKAAFAVKVQELEAERDALQDGPFSEAFENYREALLKAVCYRLKKRFPYSYGPQLESAVLDRR